MSSKIEKANKAFNQLSAAQKRVAIAQDVLAQLSARKIKATPGVWVGLELTQKASKRLDYDNQEDETIENPLNDEQLDKVLQDDTKTCHACALGSLFVCAVRKRNNITVGNARDDYYYSASQYDIDVPEEVTRDYLSKFFSGDQLHLIELAFEQGWGADTVEAETKAKRVQEELAVKFGERYVNATARLRAIMENVIDNEGTFVPPELSGGAMKDLLEDVKEDIDWTYR